MKPALNVAAPVLFFVAMAIGSEVSCAHVEPALVTRDSVVALDKTFMMVATLMDALKPDLTAAQWMGWLAFEQRFKTSFRAARTLYDDAIDAQVKALEADAGDPDPASTAATIKAASQVLSSLAAQLAYWEGVATQLQHPDGGLQ